MLNVYTNTTDVRSVDGPKFEVEQYIRGRDAVGWSILSKANPFIMLSPGLYRAELFRFTKGPINKIDPGLVATRH